MPIWYPGFYAGQDVWINDIPLNNQDVNGCRWILSDIDGWWGLPEPEVPEDTRPFSEDGSYITAGRYQSRVLTVTGHIVPSYGSSVRDVTNARNELNRVLNMVRQTGILRVDEPDAPKQARVQIVGRPLTKFNSLNGDLEFNIQFRAADPRKYSVFPGNLETTLPGSIGGRTYNKTYNYTYAQGGSPGIINAMNIGSYNTYGNLRIVGPITNPTIEHVESGKSLKFNIVLGIGDYLDIDLQRRTILLNDTASRRNTLSGNSSWFLLDSGDNTLRFSGVQQIPANEPAPARTNLITNPALRSSDLGYTISTVNGGDLVLFGQGLYGAGAYGGVGGSFTQTGTYVTTMGALDQGFYRAQYPTISSGGSSDIGYMAVPVDEAATYTGSMYVRANASVLSAQAGIIWMSGPSITNRLNLATTPTPQQVSGRWSSFLGTDETAGVTIENGTGSGPNGSTGFYRVYVETAKTAGESGITYLQDETTSGGMTGDPISASMYVRFSQAVSVIPRLTFLNAGVASGTQSNLPVAVPANTWTRISVTTTAPVGFDSVSFSAVLNSANIIDIDGTYDASQMLIESANSLGTFFSGDTADTSSVNYSWTDVPNDSVSIAATTVSSSPIGTSLGDLTTTPQDGWVRLSVTDVAPAGTESARLVAHLDAENMQDNAVLDVDNFLLENQEVLYPYFDGRSSGATWAGAPDNSQSNAPAIVGVPEAMLKLTYHSAWIE